jgi:N-sulfoglucosamine sulfohydrolase
MSLNRRTFLRKFGVGALGISLVNYYSSCSRKTKRPNILFCYTDDQSWAHTSIAGDPVVKTPNFDRVAKEGILFNNAFCAAPSCAPSRASILTGQEMWRLQEGGLLFGALPDKYKIFPKILEKSGYEIGYTGKGYWPANLESPDYWSDPLGNEYSKHKEDTPKAMPGTDYTKNFQEFLGTKDSQKPFFFWVGFYEPHRAYDAGVGKRNGMDINKVRVPSFLPDSPEVRSDLLDYYYEIEWTDRHLGEMIKVLEEAGELDNTIIVATSDNGMPFPRAKTTLYEYGTHMPLAIRWGQQVKSGRVVDDLVSLTDLAPTFLNAAGLAELPEMTGKSMMTTLKSKKSGRIDPRRDKVVTAIERHTWSRPEGKTYPVRAIRTYDWLYIYNFESNRWPAGDPPPFKPIFFEYYGDIDRGPTLSFMMENKDTDPYVMQLFKLSVDKRPQEELYNIRKDPDCMDNLLMNDSYDDIRIDLQIRLFNYLRETVDPRMQGKAPWDDYPFYFNNGDFSKAYSPNE